MSNAPRKLPDLTWPVIMLAIAIALGLGWWVAQRGAPAPVVVTVPPAQQDTGAKKDTPPAPPAADVATTPPPPAAVVPLPLPREDEEKIHNWLTEIDDTNEIAAAILSGWKQLSEPGRTAAAPHLMNLVRDENFGDISRLLLDPETNPQVKEIFFTGVLNRSDEVKWPLILQVMEQKNHPHSQDARNMLSVVLGKDFGDDWPRWRELVQTQLLKQSPP